MLKYRYDREIKKNQGYTTLSVALAIMSVCLGLLGYGVSDLAYWAVVLGLLGILFAVLALMHKRQQKKYYAILALVLSPIGLVLGLNAIGLFRY